MIELNFDLRNVPFSLFAKDFHALSIVTWWALKTFTFFHVHPEASRPLDVDRTRLLFNSAKIRLDISLNYTSKGTFHKSADIGAFLDIETAAAAIPPLPNMWQLDLGLALLLLFVDVLLKAMILEIRYLRLGAHNLEWYMFGSYLTRYSKKKEQLDVNTMNFPIKCDGGNPT